MATRPSQNRQRNEVVLFEHDSEVPARLQEMGVSAAQWNALSTSIYPGAAPESIEMALAYCKARGLDPLQKPVHIVPMYVDGGMRDVVMPGIGLYRIQAQRSGTYAGTDDIEFGPEREATLKDKDGKPVQVTYPEWARATVYKIIAGQRVSFSATVYWTEEYATDSRNSTAPNAMWRKRPRGQLAKCAESQVLRKAWPEIDAGPTVEEMEGKNQPPPVTGRTLEHEAEAPKSGTAALKAKAAAKEPAIRLDYWYQDIGQCGSMEELRQLGAKIKELDPPEPERTHLRRAMEEKKRLLLEAEAETKPAPEAAPLAEDAQERSAAAFARYQQQLEIVEKAPAIEEIVDLFRNDDDITTEQRDLLADLAAKKLDDSIPY